MIKKYDDGDTVQTTDLAAGALPPTDNLYASQWYLKNSNGVDLNVAPVWPDYTGRGVTVAFIDDGFDLNHADLAGQFNLDLDHDYFGNDADPFAEAGNNHGTAVAGIVGAANNGVGAVGIAYDADLVGLRITFGPGATDAMFTAATAAMKNYDIVNNSWGFTAPFSDDFHNPAYAGYKQGLINAAAMGRDGLGTVVIFAAGNTGASGDNVNYHNLQNSPYAITVGAIDSSGTAASFSNPGAAVLVSAPGQGIVTTDVTGAGGYVAGDYVTHNGTSFAAPMVSGVVALMLEANPDLGYRDVQEILAYSARKTGPGDVVWQTNHAANWNGGGLHFANAYGFGLVDAHAAVRLAETWTLSHSFTNQANMSVAGAQSFIIPDGGNTGISTALTILNDIIVDHVDVTLDIAHADLSQLYIRLTSPSGTIAVLADQPHVGGNTLNFTFSANNFWGELARGNWEITVIDRVTGTAGVLNSWSINVMGDTATVDNLYIYTDENTGGYVVNDTNAGIDTINASAVTRGVTIDLNASAGIENVYTGDGADFVYGNARDNAINTGRGNDIIAASGGADIINGGAGFDTYQSFDAFNHALTINGANDITLTSLADQTSVRLINVENFQFAGVNYDMAGLTAAAHSGTLTDVAYFVHGAAGIAGRHSAENGTHAYTAQDLNVGGDGYVLLEDRTFDHLTLTNNAGAALNAVSMHMDDGLNLTVRGFGEVNLVADGAHATSIDIGGGQRGFIQTGAGDDTVTFTAFLINPTAAAQERTLTAHTGDGADHLSIDDRSSYLAFDIDMGAGDDVFFAKGTQGGHILGGAGADTFAFGHNNGDATGIYDFSAAEGDRLDLSKLLESHSGDQQSISAFIELTTANNNTTVTVDHETVATLYGVTLTDPVQHYIDIGLLVTEQN